MEVDVAHRRCEAVMDEVASTVIVDEEVLEGVLTAVLARGNVLLEDVPGTGKTLTARTLSTVLGLSFSRVQFTPDLLPQRTCVHVHGDGSPGVSGRSSDAGPRRRGR